MGATNLRHVYGRRPLRGIWPGGAREEDLGVPPPQGLAHGGPLGPEFGSARENDGGDPDLLVLGPVTAVPPPVPGSRQEVVEAQDPGKQSHEGGQGVGGVCPAPPLGAAQVHQGGLAVPPANQGEAMVSPLVLCEGGGGGRGRVPAPPSPVSSPSTSSWSTRHVRNRLAAGRKGTRPGRWGPGDGVEGRGARVPRPPRSLVRQRAWSAGPPGPCFPLWGGGGGGGGGDLRPPSTSRPALGGAAVPRRLCPLSYRQPPTAAWGPAPLTGLTPAPGGDPVPSPCPGAPSWAVGV